MASAKPLSLKGKALALLAQREQSRVELRRKLLRHATAADAAMPGQTEQEVDQLLDWLQGEQLLSEARFVETRVHQRGARFGNLRIRLELAQHGMALDADTARQLKDSELARARAVWSRKFGGLAEDAAARARQMRFLAGRGFSAEVIRRVVSGEDDC